MNYFVFISFFNMHLYENLEGLDVNNKDQERIYRQIELSIEWDFYEITEIEKQIKEVNSKEYNENLFELALIKNKLDFVSLFLENDFDLKAFLTEERLIDLYNKETVMFF